MNTEIRKQILREFPELAAGYHIPIAAQVTAVADTPKQGGIADNYRPRYAVDVELIDRILENYDLESKIDSVLDMRLDDAIESALSGREVEINFNGSVTL